MKRKTLLLVLGCGLITGQLTLAASEQPTSANSSIAPAATSAAAKSVWDGLYSKEQAARGKSLYAQHCTACHGADLRTPSGPASGPPLTGLFFMNRWKGRSVSELAQFVRERMPLGQPSLLRPQESVDVVSFIFETNGFNAGAAELKSDDPALSSMRIEPKSGT